MSKNMHFSKLNCFNFLTKLNSLTFSNKISHLSVGLQNLRFSDFILLLKACPQKFIITNLNKNSF